MKKAREITFRAFRPEDLTDIEMQPAQQAEAAFLSDADLSDYRFVDGCCETAVADGAPIACAGILRMLPHRGVAWAYVGTEVRTREWPVLTQRTRQILERAHSAGLKRIEATAAFTYPAHRRWLERLGFRKETPFPMPLYGVDGEAHYLYSSVRL